MQKDKRVPKKEDMTKYGEFVCSLYRWLPIEQQKKKSKEMEDMTKEK